MADMDRNVANDGRFERHIVDATAQARQAALEAKKYAGIAVNAAEAATGAGTSWIARTDRGNVFNGCNVFTGNAAVNGSLSAGAGVFVGTCESCIAGKLRSSGDGHLYWGGCRIDTSGGSGEGCYAELGRENVFSCKNTFSSCTRFNSSVRIGTGDAGLYMAQCDSCNREPGKLANHCGDLYWGDTKLNACDTGSGYARLCGCNVFTGQNIFTTDTSFVGFTEFGSARFSAGLILSCCMDHNACLANHCGDLYWGCNKVATSYDIGSMASHGKDNVFTGSNEFVGAVSMGGVASSPGGRVDFGTEIAFHGALRILDREGNQLGSDCCCFLYNNGGDLYWGDTQLNICGLYAKLCSSNVFTGTNTFSDSVYFGSGAGFGFCTSFNNVTYFRGPMSVCASADFKCSVSIRGYAAVMSDFVVYGNFASLPGPIRLTDDGTVRFGQVTGGKVLENRNGDLYWDGTKLNINGNYAKLDCGNVFAGTNQFSSGISVSGDGISLADKGCLASCTLLYNYGDDLYWGETKLNGVDAGTGYARLDCNNVFTGENTFNYIVYVNGGRLLRLNGHIVLNDGGTSPGGTQEDNVLMNHNGDLYWGTTKLNSVVGGDVYTDRSNVFTGCNVFTSDNNRMRGLDIGTKDAYAKRLRVTENSISVISGENTVLGSTTLEKFAAFLKTL